MIILIIINLKIYYFIYVNADIWIFSYIFKSLNTITRLANWNEYRVTSASIGSICEDLRLRSHYNSWVSITAPLPNGRERVAAVLFRQSTFVNGDVSMSNARSELINRRTWWRLVTEPRTAMGTQKPEEWANLLITRFEEQVHLWFELQICLVFFSCLVRLLRGCPLSFLPILFRCFLSFFHTLFLFIFYCFFFLILYELWLFILSFFFLLYLPSLLIRCFSFVS